MELNQLEYFKELATVCHFTAAAQQIAISQPALSRSIKRLEDELGVPLFDRVGKSVSLTKCGEIFLEHTAKALQEIENGRQAISRLSAPEKGVVNLGFLHSFGSYLVPNLIKESNNLFPQIQFTLTQNSSSYLTKLLTDGEIDLLLCSAPLTMPDIKWDALCSEELFIVVPKAHHLAGHDTIKLQEIAAEPYITFKPQYGLRVLSEHFFAAAGVVPHVAFEGDEIMTVASFAAAGLGVAFIPHVPGLEHLDLKFIPISEPRCIRPICLAWNSSRYLAPSVKKIRQFMLDIFNNPTKLPLAPYYKPL